MNNPLQASIGPASARRRSARLVQRQDRPDTYPTTPMYPAPGLLSL